MIKTLYDSVKVTQTLYAATRVADVTSPDAAADTKGFESAMVVINAGNIVNASGETYAFQLVESATGVGDWTAVSGATASITADNTVALIRCDNLLALKRYLGVTLDVGASGSPSIPCSVDILLGNPLQSPVNS